MLLVRSTNRHASERRAGRRRPEEYILGQRVQRGHDGNANFAAMNARQNGYADREQYMYDNEEKVQGERRENGKRGS